MPAESLSKWLGLREGADAAARSHAVFNAACERLGSNRPLRSLDLAAGTGSNLRYVASRSSGEQHWLLVDHDQRLLDEAVARAPTSKEGVRCALETRCLDLAVLQRSLFADRQLVTASAILDLVSESWMQALAAACREAGAKVLLTLTYDGRSTCAPAEPEDDFVRDLMNRHQHTDKGLGGPAAGPEAAECAEHNLVEVGYRVRREPSDWRLGPESHQLQRELIEGWARAAVEISPENTGVVRDWLARRIAHLEAGRSRIVVGHEDLAAW